MRIRTRVLIGGIPPVCPPTPAAPAPAPAGSEPPSNETTITRFAYVQEATTVRREPSSNSSGVAKLTTITYSGSADTVLVLGQQEVGGSAWSFIRFPGLGRRVGWVLSSKLSDPERLRTSLIIDRGKEQVQLMDKGHVVFHAPVGVGARGSPTPAGRTYIRERLVTGSSNGIYGVLAFGL